MASASLVLLVFRGAHLTPLIALVAVASLVLRTSLAREATVRDAKVQLCHPSDGGLRGPQRERHCLNIYEEGRIAKRKRRHREAATVNGREEAVSSDGRSASQAGEGISATAGRASITRRRPLMTASLGS